MRIFPVLPVLLMLFALPARAQVTVDMNALDQLKKAPPAPSGGETAPRKPATAKPKAVKPAPVKPAPTDTHPADTGSAAAGKPAEAAAATGKAAPGFKAPLPALPSGPPPDVELAPVPPPVASSGKPAAKDAPPAVLQDASGTGTAIPSGLRITFGNGQGELSPASEQALKKLVSRVPASETVSYNVLAYAPGTPEDPSTPRRLSLSRALAVRSVLMDAGVPSTRIYVRALGAGTGPGGAPPSSAKAPADRVDVSVLGANAPPPELALPLVTEESTPAAPSPQPESQPQSQPPSGAQPPSKPGAGKTP